MRNSLYWITPAQYHTHKSHDSPIRIMGRHMDQHDSKLEIIVEVGRLTIELPELATPHRTISLLTEDRISPYEFRARLEEIVQVDTRFHLGKISGFICLHHSAKRPVVAKQYLSLDIHGKSKT